MSNYGPESSERSIAVYCDFENVALGAKDAKYERFDMSLVLERLLDKGQTIVKKAYADWARFKDAKKPLHETGFELIEIPHVSYSGKNSADIRMVVDALDLSYTKAHVDTFALITGDSDFSPLVAKLRENAKHVIGVGVKNSTSRLLVDSCDEFILYDDLVREQRAEGQKKKSGGDGSRAREGIERVLDVVEGLLRDRDGPLWGSHIKQTLKRKQPQFSESFYGYRNFSHLLEAAAGHDLLELRKDERSGGYLVTGLGPAA